MKKNIKGVLKIQILDKVRSDPEYNLFSPLNVNQVYHSICFSLFPPSQFLEL